MRNSSLVEWLCAEDVTGLKLITEALDCICLSYVVVGERCILAEAGLEGLVEGIQVRMPV